jgi:hypothetical protein
MQSGLGDLLDPTEDKDQNPTPKSDDPTLIADEGFCFHDHLARAKKSERTIIASAGLLGVKYW